MKRHYHVQLDEDVSEFIESRRREGSSIREVIGQAIRGYRAQLERARFEELMEEGYRWSAAEDKEWLAEFEAVDREADRRHLAEGDPDRGTR